MPGLKKAEFEKAFRFRPSREDSLVKCASCNHMADGTEDEEPPFCHNPQRLRKTKIAVYHPGSWGSPGSSDDVSSERVCDSYQHSPLLSSDAPRITTEQGEEVALGLSEGNGVVLGSQFADCIHVDPECPYVVEELRLVHSGESTEKYHRKGEVRVVDVSDTVPGEEHQDLCDMPCCEKVLQFQILDPNGYRTHVGIHPNARDPKRFVRNGITKHGKEFDMTDEEAEAAFDVTKIAAEAAESGIHAQIIAVSDYLHKMTNRLGSRPLEEAANPVGLWPGAFHLLAAPKWLARDLHWVEDSTDTGADVWMYDERLFDSRIRLEKPLVQLDTIPEGIIPCIDERGVLSKLERVYHNRSGESISPYGILKPIKTRALRSKGLTHFLDIMHVNYHAHEHQWGESGIGFSGTASFHEE